MAFIQFMLVLHGKAGPVFLPLSDLGRVGVLRTEDGGDLLEDGIPDASIRAAAVAARQTHYPFSTRDASLLVDSAVVRERARGKVFWHAPEGGGPPLSVGHAAHAFNGGVRIDDRAESSVPGLFAAGETAAGPHGADRIGGCMMTATQVFGHRAGRFAAERARACRSVPDPLPGPALMEQRRPGPNGTHDIRDTRDTRDTQALESRARSLIQASLGVLRNENALKVCLSDLRELREEADGIPWQSPADLRSLHRLRCLLSVGEAVARAALEQKSSLGAHMRTDDPRGDRL